MKLGGALVPLSCSFFRGVLVGGAVGGLAVHSGAPQHWGCCHEDLGFALPPLGGTGSDAG